MDEQTLLAKLLDSLGAAGFARAGPEIEADTLRSALIVLRSAGLSEVRLHIPHYWAVFYHDGRPGFSGNPFLVYFNDPNDDPRISGSSSPERLSQTRRLTRAEFEDGLLRNQLRRANGQPPFMFIVRQVGPAEAHPFFENDGGMAGFTEQVSSPQGEQACIFDDFIQSLVVTDKQTAELDL